MHAVKAPAAITPSLDPREQEAAMRLQIAQRQRDRLAAWGDAPLSEVTGAALLEALGTCLTGKYPERSSHLLAELFRRLGVNVTVTPEP